MLMKYSVIKVKSRSMMSAGLNPLNSLETRGQQLMRNSILAMTQRGGKVSHRLLMGINDISIKIEITTSKISNKATKISIKQKELSIKVNSRVIIGSPMSIMRDSISATNMNTSNSKVIITKVKNNNMVPRPKDVMKHKLP